MTPRRVVFSVAVAFFVFLSVTYVVHKQMWPWNSWIFPNFKLDEGFVEALRPVKEQPALLDIALMVLTLFTVFFLYLQMMQEANRIRDMILMPPVSGVPSSPGSLWVDWLCIAGIGLLVFAMLLELFRRIEESQRSGFSELADWLWWTTVLVFFFHVATMIDDARRIFLRL